MSAGRPPVRDPHGVLREEAREFGFSLVGVASARPLDDALARLRAWWHAGYGADLAWMGRNPPERADPRTLLPDVTSVVALAVEYHVDAPAFRAEARYGRVARYAWGRDYHDVVIPRLRELGARLASVFGAASWRVACDHSPLLERAVAERAGLGFFGKNTCLIGRRTGSTFLLGEILLDVELEETPAPRGATTEGAAGCGTCRRCLEACPTGALLEAYELDCRRCVSYLTIEHRGPVEPALRPAVGAWLFGCDECQEVCPFNRWPDADPWPELRPEAGVGPRVELAELLSLGTEEAFRARFRGTPLLRPERRGLVRNAAIVAANVGATSSVPALRRRVDEDPEPLIRGHALAALAALDTVSARGRVERLATRDPDAFVREEARRVLDA